MLRFRNAATALVLVLAASAAFAADSVLLRRVYKPGERYVASMTSAQDITQTAADGSAAKIRQEQRQEMTLEVLSVNAEGAAEAKVTFTRFVVLLDSPALKLDYDSADPAKKNLQHPFLAVSKILAGKSVTATVTNRGDAMAVRGIEPIIAGVLATIPEGPNRDAAQQGLRQALSEERFKQQLSIFGIPLPAEAKAAGESWDWDQTVRLDFADMAVHSVCTLDKVTNDSVEVSVTSTTKIAKTAAGVTVALDPANINTGRATIERANAALSTGTSTSTMSMTASVQGQTISSRTTGTGTLAVKRETAQ